MRKVGQLIFGTAGLSALPTQGRALRLLEEAFDGGIHHFDTAPLYGQGYAEWLLGRFISRRGSDVKLTGKFGLAGGVSPRLDPRLAMPLNYLRKNYMSRRSVKQMADPVPDRSPLAHRRITLAQVEASFTGSLKRLGCERFECYMIHEGLPSFLDDEARSWLLRQQSAGYIGSLGVATRGSALLDVNAADLEGFDILQYEAGSIFDVLMLRYPERRHFLHSCFARQSMREASVTTSDVLPHWADLNPQGKLLFFTRRPEILRQNIASFETP
jgi:aryl-alcohol dehydrogenase-like predicted oxidoreductase